MILHKKIVLLPGVEGRVFNIHDYSTIVDMDVHKGGYGDYYCTVFYTTPGDSQMNEDKKVTLLSVYEDNFIDIAFEKVTERLTMDDKYRFFKSVKIGSSSNPYRVFIYLHEELSVVENREKKIDEII